MMLSHYLQGALNDLDTLIEYTIDDIDDTKNARHDSLIERVKSKEECITTFKHKKSLIDNEIAKLIEADSTKGLLELLTEKQHEQLDRLKSKLLELKKLNKRYARIVLGVSEFYNSLLEKIVPIEMDGYDKVAKSSMNVLEVRV